jgi:checkpoint serine/threonine-protein kinase
VLTASANYPFAASDIMLVDFGRAMDAIEISDQGLYGNIAADDSLECGAMRSLRKWSYDNDAYGVCVCAYILLDGSYLDIVKDRATKTWRLRKPLRRYWQVHLWKAFFDDFLDMKSPINLDNYANKLKQIRGAFDAYLDSEKQKSELALMLGRQERVLPRNYIEL